MYIGLMSGTSVDGIDAVIVNFNHQNPELIASHYTAFSPELRQHILSLCRPGENEINRLGELDVLLGKAFADAVKTLLKKTSISPEQIHAIGSHGQTIRHDPAREFTLQIGDPNIIAAETGITTIADFRRRDIALGGQGAPLVPAFHQAVFSSTAPRAIVNIGGIANVTLLSENIIGFDTGPGNTLLDAWAEKNLQQPRDNNGEWARAGRLQSDLLNTLLNDAFFKLPAPKSTGREYFNLAWLEKYLTPYSPVDIQTTLVELTAQSILSAIQPYFSTGEIFICGGGIHNAFLMERLRALGNHYTIESTKTLGIDPDWVEAMAFAWLAKQTMDKAPGNISSVTGAKQTGILGGVYYT